MLYLGITDRLTQDSLNDESAPSNATAATNVSLALSMALSMYGSRDIHRQAFYALALAMRNLDAQIRRDVETRDC